MPEVAAIGKGSITSQYDFADLLLYYNSVLNDLKTGYANDNIFP